jgi:hypothetical protein
MLVRYGGWCSAVRCSAVREGFCWRGGCGRGCSCSCSLRSEAVSVSVRDNVSPLPPFPLCPALLCVFFFLSLFCLDLWNLQMYDAGGYPVDAAVPDIGYSALAALSTLPSNLDCSTMHA